VNVKDLSRMPQWVQQHIADLEEQVRTLKAAAGERAVSTATPLSVKPPVGDMFYLPPRSTVHFDLRPDMDVADPFNEHQLRASLASTREAGILVPRLSVYGIRNIVILPQSPNNILLEFTAK